MLRAELMHRPAQLVGTICDQSHLAPFPLSVRPVAWEYDQALRLFPLPTALILADKYLPYDVTYEDCHVFNPSGFAGSDYSWSVCEYGGEPSCAVQSAADIGLPCVDLI